MKSFPKIKHTSSIRHFHLKYSQLHKLWLSTVLISVSTIHITHRFNDFILASTAVETSPNTSRIQLNFTGGSSVLDARISAIFFLQFLGRKLKVYWVILQDNSNTKAADCNILMCNFQTVKKIAQSLSLPP